MYIYTYVYYSPGSVLLCCCGFELIHRPSIQGRVYVPRMNKRSYCQLRLIKKGEMDIPNLIFISDALIVAFTFKFFDPILD